VTRRPRTQAMAEHLIRRACRRLPRDTRDERYREWAAELPAILHDPGTRLAVTRSARALSYAAGAYRSARYLRRAAGNPRHDDRQAHIAAGVPGAWASRSGLRQLGRPRLADGVIPAITGVLLWLTLIVIIHAYPPSGSWNYLYAAAGIIAEILIVTGIVRFILWIRRQSRHTRRP
jgi:hypothetical protein